MDKSNIGQIPNGQLSTVKLILNGKLQDIVQKYSALQKLMENVDACMAKAEAKVMNHEMKNSAAESLKLATHLDLMHEQLSICQEAITTITNLDVDSPVVTPTDAAQNKGDRSVTSPVENTLTTSQGNCASAVNVVKLQLESLQQQMSCMQEAHETYIAKRLNDVETKLDLINTKEADRFNKFASQLQKSEEKQLLIDNLQLKVNDSVSLLITDVTRLKTDLVGVRDNVTKLKSHQDFNDQRYAAMKSDMDALQKLRDTLNRMNHNVSNRAELSDKIVKVQEEIALCQVLLASRENMPRDDEREILPTFTVEMLPNTVVMPGKVIKFDKISYNNWGCYDEQTNTFEAPVGGVYFFGLSINLKSTGILTAVISRNEIPVSMCTAPDVRDSQTISTSILLVLSPGDKVCVEADIQTSPRGVELSSECSHFFGFCLIKN
ncbi:unnamed protein product [Lymnaea stagnalis]|uniref:C1q domain-containing protein n=2 Tax=Lymnaea stagnalis TaxID=6523 RepID=A0AAV2HUU5_LYMST